jgi:hypothetical protein
MSRTAWQRKAPDFYARQGDTSPIIAYQLKDGNGVVVNLTGATITFIMWAPGAATAKVSAAATVTDLLLGKVSYTWAASALDTPGDYMGEWEVVFSGGAIETFPNSGYLKIRVSDDLAA